jgi:hypothetical protein
MLSDSLVESFRARLAPLGLELEIALTGADCAA